MVVWGQVKSENSSIPVTVRVSKTRLLKFPIVFGRFHFPQISTGGTALSSIFIKENNHASDTPGISVPFDFPSWISGILGWMACISEV